MSTPFDTVAVLYPGEMGAAVAAALRAGGRTVVTTLRGRGEATARRCAEGGLAVLDSMAQVASRADLVISLVPPAAAEDVAAAYCQVAHLAPPGAVYVDANSIGPDRARAIARRVTAAGRSFVDASINGLAKNFAASGTLYLSGERAEDVARVFDGAARVRVLGGEVGRASAMKMLLGGLSKGVCALFTELALLAERQGMLEEMLEAASRTYGGVTAVADRMLPTYPLHAARRETEMSELEDTARAAGVTPRVVAGVRRLHEAMARAYAGGGGEGGEPGLADEVRRLARRLSETDEV